MDHDLRPLLNAMVASKLYDGWQFIQCAIKSNATAKYCISVIDSCIHQYENKYNDWFRELTSHAYENIGSKIEISFPKYITKVADLDINSAELINKLTKDFFQYARNTFDYIAQIANVVYLRDKRKKTESVDFKRMQKVFDQQTYSNAYPQMHSWFDNVANSSEYIYLDDFCNRTKHICDVYVNLSISLFGGESKAIINPFFKNQTEHPVQDVKTYLECIWNYVVRSLNDFIRLLENDVGNNIVGENRYHQLLGYQQTIKDSPDNSFAFIYIYATNVIDQMAEEIEVLFLQQDPEDGHINAHNCPVETIYVAEPQDKFNIIAAYKAEEQYYANQTLYYRKYKKYVPDNADMPLIMQITTNQENKDMKLYPNPYISYENIEA